MALVRAILIFWLVLEFLISRTRASAPVCDESNAFLDWLRTVQPEAVLSTVNTNRPDSGWEVCNKTWATNGTCCDVDNLKVGFNKVVKKYKWVWEEFIYSLRYFSAFRKSLVTFAGGPEVGRLIEEVINRSNNTVFTGAQAQALINRVDRLDTDIAEFKKSAQSCFIATQKVLTNIFCSGCQGRGVSSTEYWYLYRINAGTCNKAVEACFPVWSLMFNVQAQIGLMLRLALNNSMHHDSFTDPSAWKYALRMADCAQGITMDGLCSQYDFDIFCGLWISFMHPNSFSKPFLPATVDMMDSSRNSSRFPHYSDNDTSEFNGTGFIHTSYSKDLLTSINDGIDCSLEDTVISADVMVDTSGFDALTQQTSEESPWYWSVLEFMPYTILGVSVATRFPPR